ncbi:hypothetical protein FJ656_01640 [Schumannella luteola]|nr:hypothetical protein FJ656_01640 [Schumannella luteola]
MGVEQGLRLGRPLRRDRADRRERPASLVVAATADAARSLSGLSLRSASLRDASLRDASLHSASLHSGDLGRSSTDRGRASAATRARI